MNSLLVPLSRTSKSLLLFSALAATVVTPAIAQIRPMGVPVPAAAQPKPIPPVAPPGTPAPPQAAPVPVPLPPAVWDVVSAEDLLRYIQQIGIEGLNPA
ncbi:MAG: hypothetical protein V4502_09420, partial [Pseudomonadota bacterium]